MRIMPAFLSAALCLSAAPALAQSSDPAWLDDMNFQLRAEKQCEVIYIVRMGESQLGANTVYEARVQCADGRMFDASRIGPSGPFEIRACEVQTC